MSRKRPPRRSSTPAPHRSRAAEPARLWQAALDAYRRGKPAAAERALAPLLEHPAADGNTFLLAGIVAAQRDNMPRAAHLLEKATRLSPDNPEAWLSLGNVRHSLGRMDAALDAYQASARLAPGNAQVWNNLGVISEDIGRTRDALDYYDRALEVDASLVNARRRRAPVLGRLRWFEAARAAYQDLLARYPDDPVLRIDYAQFLELANRPADAATQLPSPDLLTDRVQLARVAYIRAQLSLRSGELDTALDEIRAARARTGEDFLGYREGAILDRLGRYAEAMEAFERANRASARQKDYKRLLAQPLTEYLARKAECALSPPPAGTASDDSAPVFITGLPRSGTTLLDRMLAAHPDIQVLEELEALHVAENALEAGASDTEARAAYWRFVERHVTLRPNVTLVDKNPIHVMHLDVLPRLFPRARVIYMLRHPFDAALSCFMQDFDPGPVTARFLALDTTGALCARFLQLMQRYEAARPGQVIRVRYEDLVSDFEHEVRRVLDAMGLAWHADIADYAAIAARAAPIMTASYEQVTRGVYRSSLERWRHYAPWLAPFHDTLGKWLTDFDYTC